MLLLSSVRAGRHLACSATLLRSFRFVPLIMCRFNLSGSPGVSMSTLIHWVESLILTIGASLQIFPLTFRLFSVLSQSIGSLPQIQPSVPNFGAPAPKAWTLSALIGRARTIGWCRLSILLVVQFSFTGMRRSGSSRYPKVAFSSFLVNRVSDGWT